MRLLLAAGGTGGHVIPALVVAREFCARDAARQVLFVGTVRGVETRMVPQAGFSLELLKVGALQGQAAAVRLKTVLGLPGAFWRAIRILDRFQPHVVLGVGGYAAGPVMLAAGWLNIPVAVLEPNAFPGLANRWAAPYVPRAFLAFPETASYFAPGKAVLVGVPVRKDFFEIPPKHHVPPYTILVFGGSQGARSLNRAVVEALPFLAHSKEDLLLLHQTGEREYNAVREACAQHSVQAEVFPYLERMSEAFNRADLVVCRAGANTVAELAAAGRAAILVPYPSAANQHQLRNAEALARIGAARLILDRDLNGERLFSTVWELLHNPAELKRMETAIRRLAHPEASSRIVDELERLSESEPRT